MRKCPNCQDNMRYDVVEKMWKCYSCSYEIKKVTINGDRFLSPFESW